MTRVIHSFTKGIGIGIVAVLIMVLIAAVGLPKIVGGQTFTITGTSMEPTIPLGSFIVTKPASPENITVGDVVTFQLQPGNPAVATHRVVGVSYTGAGQRQFTTQGDNNNAPDGDLLHPVQIVGKQWYTIPFLGWVTQGISAQLRAWIIPLASGALLIYGVWMVISGVRERSQHSRKQHGDNHPDGAPSDSPNPEA